MPDGTVRRKLVNILLAHRPRNSQIVENKAVLKALVICTLLNSSSPHSSHSPLWDAAWPYRRGSPWSAQGFGLDPLRRHVQRNQVLLRIFIVENSVSKDVWNMSLRESSFRTVLTSMYSAGGRQMWHEDHCDDWLDSACLEHGEGQRWTDSSL